MRFIISGHKGLIGSFLLKKLKEIGHEPVFLVDKREGRNVLDVDSVSFNGKIDLFIHLADFCKINKTIENPENAFENSVGIPEVLEFCRKYKIPKIIFFSSSRVLNKEKNPYTASKIYGEELCKAYSECYGINYLIIRPSTVYGHFNDRTKRLVDIFILNVLEGRELKMFGNENKTLVFTYIDDFIRAFLLVMDENNKEFDIASGKGINVSYVADLIIGLNGQRKKTFYSSETAQPQEVELDISKLREFGFEPQVSIGQGIKKTLDWYKKNFYEIVNTRQKSD
ncbi:NAD-dependent epimerase/dehydratase family protein [Candidatus Pacearchaeota archaeon]|nr:NAD-dependent epimerase/dehydratase family protein [Candidatus Pacearchaeota archaeon]MBD3283217.1 NAD-dependent epimerase/dehydratase family protein [Candidatus Pacearchaeota archaeon]